MSKTLIEDLTGIMDPSEFDVDVWSAKIAAITKSNTRSSSYLLRRKSDGMPYRAVVDNHYNGMFLQGFPADQTDCRTVSDLETSCRCYKHNCRGHVVSEGLDNHFLRMERIRFQHVRSQYAVLWSPMKSFPKNGKTKVWLCSLTEDEGTVPDTVLKVVWEEGGRARPRRESSLFMREMPMRDAAAIMLDSLGKAPGTVDVSTVMASMVPVEMEGSHGRTPYKLI